jgi:hypothetical protein
VSNYLLTRHRLARFAGPVPGSFHPDYNSEFFLHSLVVKALRSGSILSCHRLCTEKQCSEALTPFHFLLSLPKRGLQFREAALLAISLVVVVCNIGWLLHCIFLDPALPPELPAESSPFLFQASLAGLLMRVIHLISQPRTTAAWDASAKGNLALGLQNSVALLHRVGKLFQLFSDWGTPMAPRQHCFVATQAAHLGRTDVAVLGASTTKGDTLPAKLELWLAQFALWFHPEALRSEPPKEPAFQFPFHRFYRPQQRSRQQKGAQGSVSNRKDRSARRPRRPHLLHLHLLCSRQRRSQTHQTQVS